MSDIVIKTENLGKKYVIGHATPKGHYITFREVLMQNARGFWHKVRDLAQGKPVVQGDSQEEVWALKDVSFEIERGQVVGIIGRNGAGKSTLLKILSRITDPSTGRVTIKGRVASLLEIGTGFHPELTGRENVYLNGAILGMTRAEIKRKFDEIVAFAEVEKFLDTPVKRYSSGMYVRLAFAVAAHLEPEIMIVDEVLAVGDAQFQKKCLGKMKDVSTSQGRTVLFVSHNMQAVRQLCERVILLADGVLQAVGDSSAAISMYLGQESQRNSRIPLKGYTRHGSANGASFELLEYLDDKGNGITQADRATSIAIRVTIDVEVPVRSFDLAMAVIHVEGQRVFSEILSDQLPKPDLSPGRHAVQVVLPLKYLKVGSYFLSLCAQSQGRVLDIIENLPMPEIVDCLADPHMESHRWGVVRIPVEWSPPCPAS